MKQAIYIVPYKVNGIQIPARIQATLARSYLNEINGNFELPKTESLLDNNLPVLRDLVRQKYDTIIMYSHLMLATKEGLAMLKEKINQDSSDKTLFYFTFSKRLMDEKRVFSEIKSKIRHNKFGFNWESRMVKEQD